MYLTKRRVPVYFDIGIIIIACFIAFFAGIAFFEDVKNIIAWKLFLTASGINIIFLYFSDGYYSNFKRAKFDIKNDLFSIIKGVVISFIILAAVFLMNSSWRNPEFFLKLGVASTLIFVFLYGMRSFEYQLFYEGKKIVLVILSRNQSIFDNMKKDLMAHISKDWYVFRLSPDDRFLVLCNVAEDVKGNQESIKGLNFICNGEEKANKDSLNALISNKKYTPIIITDQTGSKDDVVCEFLVFCYNNQVPIFNCFDFYEAICKKALIFRSNGVWFWDFSYLRYSMTKIMTKRSFDMILALFLLPLVIVPGLLIAFLIKIESKGPILFVQERAGLRRKIFKMLKFRTMIVHPDDSEQWPKMESGLVTRFGHFLRKTGLDEIPQLINILRGEMSFVGPRPARPKVAEMHCRNIPFFALTHSVMPGITGWAQLNQGQDSGYDTILERIKYNAYYMKHYSILLDLYIILKTAKMAFKIKKPESTQAKVQTVQNDTC